MPRKQVAMSELTTRRSAGSQHHAHNSDPTRSRELPGSYLLDPTRGREVPGSYLFDLTRARKAADSAMLFDPTRGRELQASAMLFDPTRSREVPGSYLLDPTRVRQVSGSASMPVDRVPGREERADFGATWGRTSQAVPLSSSR